MPRSIVAIARVLVLVALGILATPGSPPGAASGPLAGADPPDWGSIVLPRHPAPSPDGTQIAFSYQGDLWVVASGGGEARRLTAHPAYDGTPVWSPDGRWIAFSSDRDGNFDVFALPVEGGAVRRLTWHSDNDRPTDWSADGRYVWFDSRRFITDGSGSGLFRVPLEGGTPLPLFTTGANLAVVSHDGTKVAYTRGGSSWWRRGYEGNGRVRLWLWEADGPDSGATFPGEGEGKPGGRRDSEDPAGVEAAIARPATLAGLLQASALRAGGSHRRLAEWRTSTEGDPLTDPAVETGGTSAPQWFPDGEHLLYLSESAGVSNLKILSLRTGERAFVTRFRDGDGRLRYPSLARNGRLAAFEYEDGIYTVRIPAELPVEGSSTWPEIPSAPERLSIRLPFDPKVQALERARVTSGADEVAVSPDGAQIALVAHGEIFVMKASENEPYANRITETTARERDITWMPDSKSLLFASDREGQFDLWLLRSADPGESRLARALRTETIRLTQNPAEDREPRPSPDGKRIAFVRAGGTLLTMAADGGDEQVVTEGWSSIDFRWSPDSRWIAFAREDNDFNSDVWIVAADGSREPKNLSRHPQDDTAPRWSADGKVLVFSSSRSFIDQTDVWFVWLSRSDDEKSRLDRLDELAAAGKGGGKPKGAEEDDDEDKKGTKDKDKEKKEVPAVAIDFDDIHRRLRRLSTLPGREGNALVSKDASEFVFVSDTDGKRDLWKVKWDGSDPERLTKGDQDPRQIQWTDKGDRIFFLKRGGTPASVALSGGELTTYSFEGEMSLDRRAERTVTFDEGWRALRDGFYDPEMHGVDWESMGRRYRPWAVGASTHRDFHDAVRMMLGELNASHLNIWGGSDEFPEPSVAAQTGELGVFFDASWSGPGFRISHTVAKSPADRVASRLEPGEVVLAVRGEPVGPDRNLSRLLDRTVDQKILLSVRGTDGKQREVVIRPTSSRTLRELLYEEEVRLRETLVHAETGGTIAYVHVADMGIESLEAFERDLYAEAHDHEVLMIDVRDNPGGWITDLLLTSITAPQHAVTKPRGGGPGYPQDRRLLYAWTKPIVVLADENSFSNAEIFTWAVKTLRRGPVIGQRTAGGVISTGGTTLADGSYLRMPFRGWVTRFDGSNMEGTGAPPDIEVENHPGDLARGLDRQLKVAIREGMKLVP